MVYRICKRFTVESGHMLSKHAERCRYPHGHSRDIEVVVAADHLDENGMVVDFKALKLAIGQYVQRYDHAMAVNSEDPLLPAMQQLYPQALIVFEGQEPTTEAIAKDLFEHVACVLREGFLVETLEGVTYRIPAGAARLERVRVWETPTSWAEVGA